MNHDITSSTGLRPVNPGADGGAPVLIVPYMWIGDFVRCLSVVKVLKARWPHRPIDLLTTTLCAPLLDYAPGVRKGIVQDLPRKRLPLRTYTALARRLRTENYGTALIMLRTWKSALAPFLAGIPERVGFAGEMRFGLLNDVRWGEKRLERMIDRCGVLALPKDALPPPEWPLPELVVPAAEVAAWKDKNQLSGETSPVVALAPGAVGRGKKWPTTAYAELAKVLAGDGIRTWVLGGPGEKAMAQEIVAEAGPAARDLTGHDLRNAILAIGAADAVVSNDSGLMHVAAAIGTPTIGIFGPTSPRLWAPLNPVAAILEPPPGIRCPTCGERGCPDIRHRRTDDVSVTRVHEALLGVLSPHLDAAF
jgi:heptosyltransferase-2